MADDTVPRIVHGTLTASGVSEAKVGNKNMVRFEVTNVDGAAAIYFNWTSADDPVVEGENCEVVPAAVGASITCLVSRRNSVSVQLISEGNPKFSVAAR